MENHHFRVTLKHDRGRVTIQCNAENSEKAIERVLQSENAPFSAFLTVYAINPTPHVSGRYGSPMGRGNSQGFASNPARSQYRACRVRIDRDGCDPGGAYWGIRPRGLYLYAVQDGEGGIAFVDAPSSRDAIGQFFQ